MSVNLEQYRGITLQEFYDNRDFFKKEYQKLRKPPYYRLQQLREFKNFIYLLDMRLYIRDRIWEYLNDDISEEYFGKFVEGVYKGQFK